MLLFNFLDIYVLLQSQQPVHENTIFKCVKPLSPFSGEIQEWIAFKPTFLVTIPNLKVLLSLNSCANEWTFVK